MTTLPDSILRGYRRAQAAIAAFLAEQDAIAAARPRPITGALRYYCGECRAEIGEPCRNPQGKICTPHHQRQEAEVAYLKAS